MQNDLGILEVSRPFDLFGPQPHKGSAFYIGHQEALHKKVHYININFDWYKLPDNFQNHYAAYSKEQNQQFAIDIQVLHQKQWCPIQKQNNPNFEYTLFKNGDCEHIELDDIKFTFDDKLCSFPAHVAPQKTAYLDNSTQHGFLKFRLIKPHVAFGHQEYPNLYATILSKNLIHDTHIFINNN